MNECMPFLSSYGDDGLIIGPRSWSHFSCQETTKEKEEKVRSLGKNAFSFSFSSFVTISFYFLFLFFLIFFTFSKFINHKAIDYKIISSPFTSYLLFCSAKKVLYPSAPFAFITHFSRYGPSRVITHNHNHNNSLSLSLTYIHVHLCFVNFRAYNFVPCVKINYEIWSVLSYDFLYHGSLK